MLNTKEYFNQVDATLAIEELDNETAAAIQGGAAMTLYRNANLTGDILGEFNGGGLRRLSSNANDQASSVRITEGKWKFYNSRNWSTLTGSVELGVGDYNFVKLNDKISSFRRVG